VGKILRKKTVGVLQLNPINDRTPFSKFIFRERKSGTPLELFIPEMIL